MHTNTDIQETLQEVGPVVTLRQALALFVRMGMPARNLSARTRVEYTSDLTDLIEYLERQGIVPLSRVTLQHLTAYQAEMDRRSYRPSTRSRKTHAIKSWFRFLYNQGVIAKNVAGRLIPPRAGRLEPRFLSEIEYRHLLHACNHHPRDRAIIELLLQTGMRLSELARLTLNDIELPARASRGPDDTGTVYVTRKLGSVDAIPLNYKACRALSAWLEVRPAVEHEALFVSKFGTLLGKRAIQQVVQKYLDAAGIRDAAVHTLRHTMATHHIARGTPAKTVQKTLGHASLATTTVYVAMAKKAQRKALQDHAL